MDSRERMSSAEVWTLFPMAGLLSFAGWVALLVATTPEPSAVIVFVSAFLGAAWKVCRTYHRFQREQDERLAERQRLEQVSEWWSE